jgi:phosphoglycolate phosphatase-like HAD superfamily hydrolase
VTTGKYSADDAHEGAPDHVIDSIGDLPTLLETS